MSRRGIQPKKYKLICQWKECRSTFNGYRSSDKFCSSECRYKNTAANYTAVQKERRAKAFKKWGEANWLKRRAYHLNYNFGISLEQYNDLLIKQNYCCFICRKHETEFAKKLAVDHDHVTGEIYGLLCQLCNKDLIGKRRDPELFKRAAEYLETQKSGWFVPDKRPKRRRRRKKR